MTKNIIEFTENEIFCFEFLKSLRIKKKHILDQNKDYHRVIFEGKSLIFDLRNFCPNPDYSLDNIYYGNLETPIILVEEETPDLFERIIGFLKGLNHDR